MPTGTIEQSWIVGTAASCSVRVDPTQDPYVSVTHCRVDLLEDGRYVVTDLGSTNGTHINNTRIRSGVPTQIKPGDTLVLSSRTRIPWARPT